MSNLQIVLVHGAGHGAWCWYKVATLLRAAGFRVSAHDMAASGVNLRRVEEVYSNIIEYVEPLMEFMEALPQDERVVLVGHSMGGVSLSLAMERFHRKIAVAVFVTAFMPSPDLKMSTIMEQHPKEVDSLMDTQFQYDQGLDKPPTSFLLGPKLLASKLYQLSPPEDLTLATTLVRPHPQYDWEKTSMEIALTWEKYGSVRRVYIVSDHDRIITEELQRWMIKNNPPNAIKVIPGSDHMVMFSKPQELSSCLQEIAEQKN